MCFLYTKNQYVLSLHMKVHAVFFQVLKPAAPNLLSVLSLNYNCLLSSCKYFYLQIKTAVQTIL